MEENKLFTPYRIGPVELRNRTIRSAAFEGMAEHNSPSKTLYDYHTSVARGGIGMTTVAYAAVCRSGLSFERQLWMREEIVPQLRELTDGIHAEGAKASIQLGHCGNMSHKKICGCRPYGASSGFNLYSPTLVHGMTRREIDEVVEAYGHAVELAIEAGFDAVEIHAGHGYLISQFLSPYTNKRKDEFGGSLENRMKFMKMVMDKVVKAGKGKVAIFVKINTRDGFKGGMETDDCITVAKELQKAGADALVLSGGFVSRAPMYVMRGEFPVMPIIHYMPWRQWWLKLGVLLGGRLVSPTVTYKRLFFLEDAKKFREALPDMPLVYVGGVNSRKDADEVMDAGFEMLQMGRAVLCDPGFVNKMKEDKEACSGCEHSNFCIGRMYSLEMCCEKTCGDITPCLRRSVARTKRRNARREAGLGKI